ncbi:MAG: glycosyltransferase family 4 protein [Candidatus Pseudomonas phytovorans]|uniref:Glycosyltransferase family 4 protein n=1 Tax=Candidatus Pseudomonas phytovorans TaxID=3121377 RepID=A0AAJ6BBT5_9PSED|nr:glycosyltransferase family 4 protein [Pseudomonas sp.]WEK30517.1 MAG: glycosyltransferase family 4 protein [Pseudomonas sp.]
MIEDPYILFTRIPVVVDEQGNLFTDPLWVKDIELHLSYIEHFSMCCPVERSGNLDGLQSISHLDIKRLYGLRKDYGLASVLKNFIPNFITVFNACKRARIVHSDGAGWAFPLSFYVLPLKPFLRFQWVIVIESSFWMLAQGQARTLRALIEHHVHTVLLKRCVKLANARIFTQSFYKDYFLGRNNSRTLINPASWLDKKFMAAPETVRKRFEGRRSRALHLLYPSRLVLDKGVLVVLEAIEQLEVEGVDISVTLMGEGDLKAHCLRFAAERRSGVQVSFLNAVDYGKDFFSIIAQHDWLLVPTLKQEQPRIIFDAFSQGVPVIGSDTSGVLDITSKRNALTFETGNPSSLAERIRHAARHPGLALEMGLAGLDYATGKTHLQMHQVREEFLKSSLTPSANPRAEHD